MSSSLAPPAMLGLTVVVMLGLRNRSAVIRLSVEGLLLCALAACFAAWRTSPLRANLDLAQRPDAIWLRALAVIWWLIGARLCSSIVVIALGRDAQSRQARLLSDLVAAAIYLTAGLVVLNSVLGLQVKGLIATSGLIAILLGLASQSTLADVFSGVAIGLDAPFHPGDRVSIGDQEGVVVQVNWRSLRLQTDDDDIVVIPNSLLAKSLIVNRSVPTLRRAASVEIPIPLARHGELPMELLRQAALLAPGVLAEPAVGVSLRRLGTRTATYVVSFHVASSAELSSARSQLLHEVRRLLAHAGLDGAPAPEPARLVASLRPFERLSPAQIDGLVAALVPHRLNPGAALYQQGGEGGSIYIVRSGVLEVSRRAAATGVAAGAILSCARLGPGDYLGELSMMSGKPHPVSATALTRCELWELPRPALAVLLEDEALSDAFKSLVRQDQARLDREEAAQAPHPPPRGPTLAARLQRLLRLRLTRSAERPGVGLSGSRDG